MTKLTAKKVKNAAPRSKEYKLHDGEGLFLRIRPSGAKSWLFSFSLPGDRRLIRMTIGSADRVSLKEARSMLPALHKLVANGIDPRYAQYKTRMLKNVTLSLLLPDDIEEIAKAFHCIGWNKPKHLYEGYLLEQTDEIRTVFIARSKGKFSGYVTIKWKSAYDFFQKNNVPEIVDLNVLPHYQCQGIGTQLIKACETLAKKRGFNFIGLGVGLISDYGSAQKLYVKLGYIPDGQGLFYKNSAVPYNAKITADDDLIIHLWKRII